MKRWWGRVLAWLGVVGLLCSLGLAMTGVKHEGHAGWLRSGAGRKFISLASSPTLLATNTPLLGSRASRTVESFATPGALLTAGDVGPPWLEYRGPPGVRGRHWVSCKVVGHAGSFQRVQNTLLQRNSDQSTDQIINVGFWNSL
jgi:hypothetical protein